MANWISECVEMIQQAQKGWWIGELGKLKRQGHSPETIKAHLAEFLSHNHTIPSNFRKDFSYYSPENQHRVDVDKELDQRQKARRFEHRGEGKPTRLADIIELPGMP